MEQRINYGTVAPEGIRALSGLESYIRSCGLEAGLIDLVKVPGTYHPKRHAAPGA